MRKLKFRVWDKTLNQWTNNISAIGADGELLYLSVEVNDNNEIKHKVFTVNPDRCVVQQYTGMKDEDETEIYDGDIVEFHSSHKALVRWSSSGGCWEAAPIDKKYAPAFDINDPEEDYVAFNGFDEASLAFSGDNGYPIKIIGNIFENPDLLK